MMTGNAQYQSSIGWPPFPHHYGCLCQNCRPTFRNDFYTVQKDMEIINLKCRISELERIVKELSENINGKVNHES